MATDKQYEIDLKANYIYLKFKGKLSVDDLKGSTEEILQLAEKHDVHCLLDNIREIDTSSINMGLQSQAIANLWKLRSFKKIALVFSNQEVGYLVLSTLETLHLPLKCRAFDNEPDAIAWINEQ